MQATGRTPATPYPTEKVIDPKLAETIEYRYIYDFVNNMNGEYSITENQFNNFKNKLGNKQLTFDLSRQYAPHVGRIGVSSC